MRHTQAIILAAVLLAGIVSGGCTRIHSAEDLTKDTQISHSNSGSSCDDQCLKSGNRTFY